MGIYVEIFIRAPMEDLWQKTQEPKLHERWDLRFSRIDYLPRQPDEPQRFLYSTRIGAGIRIDGEGESTGEHDGASGQRTSALKFWSKDPKSLIEVGSGTGSMCRPQAGFDSLHPTITSHVSVPSVGSSIS
jgi:hypothetical protein